MRLNFYWEMTVFETFIYVEFNRTCWTKVSLGLDT